MIKSLILLVKSCIRTPLRSMMKVNTPSQLKNEETETQDRIEESVVKLTELLDKFTFQEKDVAESEIKAKSRFSWPTYSTIIDDIEDFVDENQIGDDVHLVVALDAMVNKME